jgi:hypothetical protein
VKHDANPDLARAMQEKRRSNAATTHQDKRTKRARSRAAQKGRAIREQKD